jgi:hypothetical protein
MCPYNVETNNCSTLRHGLICGNNNNGSAACNLRNLRSPSDAGHELLCFVSRFFTPGCEAVDATKLDWKVFASPAEVVWVFPPYRQVSLALSFLESAKLEAFVCMPIKAGSNELIQLHHMQGAHISAPYLVPRNVESCIPSARVPSGSLNPALLELGIVHVSWS